MCIIPQLMISQAMKSLFSKNVRGAVTKTARNFLPYLSLVAYVGIGSSVFYLLQRYSPVEPSDLQYLYSGMCADCTGPNETASFGKAFYFMSTVYSSIGYGDVVPCTWLGKLLTLIFALTGVPLTLFCLGKLGRFLRRIGDRLWNFLKRSDVKSSELSGEHLPLAVGIVMTFAWIFLSSGVFLALNYYETEIQPVSWNYFDAIYFTVISLFTIGFGDYHPANRTVDVVTFFFIFIGLSLVSMCVAIAQKSMETQFDRVIHMISQVYKDGQLKVDQNGKIKLSTAEKNVANIVLEMWKADPAGQWLSPLMQQSQGAASQADPPPGAKVGKTTQRLMMDKWRSKAHQKVQDRQTRISSIIDDGELTELNVCCDAATQTDFDGSSTGENVSTGSGSTSVGKILPRLDSFNGSGNVVHPEHLYS